jgi:hypothetical protein
MGVQSIINDWVVGMINEVVELGGSLVDEITYEKRKEICQGCEHFGEVRPLFFAKLEGCTKCGCPLATKPRFKEYFSPEEGRLIQAICPHENGNKWDF